MHECLNYEKLERKAVQCRACSHFCRIQEGRVGICGVRQNAGGLLNLLVYGRAVAANVDPVEKKPLFHFLPGSSAFSFGTAGCNFRCLNCQNYDISQMFGSKGKVEEYSRIGFGIRKEPEDIVAEAIENGCKSIAYTYNEPTIFMEYALDTMKLAHSKGIKNIWVSNGYMSQDTLYAVTPHLDAINVDIKSFDDDFYKTNCGARVAPVLENCRELVKRGVWLEITTLVIPTLSDGEKMLHKIASFIKKELGDNVPWHVSAFSGAISWKLKHLGETSAAQVKVAYDIGKKAGLKYVYAGNVWETDLESTYCPKCGRRLIERSGYRVKRLDKDGRCPSCSTVLDGILK